MQWHFACAGMHKRHHVDRSTVISVWAQVPVRTQPKHATLRRAWQEPVSSANSSTIARHLQKPHSGVFLGSTMIMITIMSSQGVPWAASCEEAEGPSCGAGGAARQTGQGVPACAACWALQRRTPHFSMA